MEEESRGAQLASDGDGGQSDGAVPGWGLSLSLTHRVPRAGFGPAGPPSGRSSIPQTRNPYPSTGRIMLWFAHGAGGAVPFRGDRQSHGTGPGNAAQGGGAWEARRGPGAARPLVRPAPVGDVLPAGRAGGGPAGAVRAEQLGPDPARPVVGAARAGGARRLVGRPGAGRGGDRAAAGGAGVPDGGVPAAALRLARGGRPGAERRPRPAGDRPAQLRGGGPGGRPGLPPRPALAGAGGGAVRGGPDRVQPQPAGPDAAGDADDPGAGRDAGGAALLRRATSAWRPRSSSRPVAAGAARRPGRSSGAWRWA